MSCHWPASRFSRMFLHSKSQAFDVESRSCSLIDRRSCSLLDFRLVVIVNGDTYQHRARVSSERTVIRSLARSVARVGRARSGAAVVVTPPDTRRCVTLQQRNGEACLYFAPARGWIGRRIHSDGSHALWGFPASLISTTWQREQLCDVSSTNAMQRRMVPPLQHTTALSLFSPSPFSHSLLSRWNIDPGISREIG